MTTINQLSGTDSISLGDLIPIFSTNNGQSRKMAVNQLIAVLQSQITSTDDKLTQYAQPNATGFQIQVNNDSLSVFLIITPLADYAAGTLILPLSSVCADKQEIHVISTRAITTLTINANGSNIVGAPSTLAANGFFKLRFDKTMSTQYRIG